MQEKYVKIKKHKVGQSNGNSQHVESQTELLKRNFEVKNQQVQRYDRIGYKIKSLHLFLRMLFDLKRHSCLHK